MKYITILLGIAVVAVSIYSYVIIKQKDDEYSKLLVTFNKTHQLLNITQGDLVAICTSVEQDQKGKPYNGITDLVKIIRGRLAENTITTKDGVTMPRIPQ